MSAGTLVLNGITIMEFANAIEAVKTNRYLIFSPHEMETVAAATKNPLLNNRANISETTYNNVTFRWKDPEGLETVIQVLRRVNGTRM